MQAEFQAQRDEDDQVLGVWYLSNEEEDRCRELFNAVDKDRRGKIDPKELKILIEMLGHQNVTEREVSKIMSKAVLENYGYITYG